MKWFNSLSVVLVISFTLTACGGGGGDGGTGGPPPTTVSGTVQAPNGQVAFHQPTLWDVFESSAFASLSGLTPVPDGTPVQLGRMSSAGSFTVLASATVSGGRYSFNLTSLGLTITSDLVVEVSNPATGARMRAFVTRESVDLSPLSETAVQVVLDHIVAAPGTSLSSFTVQELTDIVSAIDALTAVNQASAGVDINSTVTTIKKQAVDEPQLMTFLMAADAPGQTTEGPGDIGNYIPLDRPMSWTYQGTEQSTGQPLVSYSNAATIAGTTMVNGVLTTVLSQTNPLNGHRSIDSYYTEDSRGLTFHGDNDTSDVLTPQLVPYLSERLPFGTGSSFEEINRKGLDFGEDLDGDGKNEKIDILSIAKVLGFESVSVPAGPFPNCAKVETTSKLTAIASSNGATVSLLVIDTTWYAPGVGPVKEVLKAEDVTVTEELTSFTQTNARFLTLPNASNLISDPVRTMLYAAVGGTPGNITLVDPTKAKVGPSIPVGIDPAKLAVSDNGQFLYVGLGGESSVQRIDLATRVVNLTFPLGVNQFAEPRFVDDMEVLPGAPDSVAITRRRKGLTPRYAGVAIYDNGVQRPTEAISFLGSTVIEFSTSPSALYGYNTESIPAEFFRMAINQSGVSVLDATQNLINDLGDIEFDRGLIYSTGGTVVNPENLTVVGSFPVVQPHSSVIGVRPDSNINRVFFLIMETTFCCNGPIFRISAFDINTRQLLGSENIPGVTGDPSNLVRWGAKGLAFRTTGGQVFLVESPNLIP